MSGLTEPSQSYKPFKYPWAIDAAVEHEKIHWIEAEAELQEDVNQWKSKALTDSEKNHITQILRLFTQTDTSVAGNYCDLFIPYFKNNEIRSMLLAFAAREGIHQRAYALLNDTLGLHEKEYTVFLDIPAMAEKIEFMEASHVFSKEHMGKLLAQAVCNEGMSLFSAFVMLLNYQRFGKMKGMCTIVEWSVRDESMHTQYMAKLFQEFCKENPEIVTDKFKTDIYNMYKKAVELEDQVIDLSYSEGAIEGLEASQVKEYIRYIADRRLIQIGMKPIFKIKDNPLPWLDWILSGDSLSNFFEKRVSDYSVDAMSGEWEWE